MVIGRAVRQDEVGRTMSSAPKLLAGEPAVRAELGDGLAQQREAAADLAPTVARSASVSCGRVAALVRRGAAG